MNMETKLQLQAKWDFNVVPALQPCQRGLLITVVAPTRTDASRQPANLSLVIDRSGSMAEDKLEAAKEAAIGVVEQLDEHDLLSVVAFDDQIETLAHGVQMDEAGKRLVSQGLAALQARGSTDLLGAGWFEGAACAADAVDSGRMQTGHIVILSDGMANCGLTSPDELRNHAAALAARGVTTSAVGIGNSYSPLQLDALAQGGGGRLHDSETPDEIVEVVRGELGEAMTVAANSVEVTIRWRCEGGVARLLSRFEHRFGVGSVTALLGQLRFGSQRRLPVLFDVPAFPVGERLSFDVELQALDPESGEVISASATTELTVVPVVEAGKAIRDQDVAKELAGLWQTQVAFEAMEMNEFGELRAAETRVDRDARLLQEFSKGTGIESEILRNLAMTRKRVGAHWGGRSKREAMISAKKMMRDEDDYRSDPKGQWIDKL